MRLPGSLSRLAILAAPVSGLLLAFSQSPFPTGWIAFVALVPYLVAFEARLARASGGARGLRLRRELGHGYLLGLGCFGLMLYWIAFLPPDEMAYSSLRFPAAIAMVLYLSLYALLFGLVLAILRGRGRVPLVIAAPVAWNGAEWLRGSGPLAFPWGSLGYAPAAHPAAIQSAAWIGVLGLSAWIALANALAANALAANALPTRAARRAGAWAWSAAFALVVALPIAFGAAVLAGAKPGGPAVRVALVQPNVAGVEKWRPNYRDWNLAILDSMTIDAGKSGADIIIWPETAATAYLRFDKDYAMEIYRSVAAAGKPVIAGFLDAEAGGGAADGTSGADAKRYRTYNAAGLIFPRERLQATYRKMHLVPFGEEMPFQQWIPPLRRLDLGEADFDRGTAPVLLETGGVRAGVLICFEAIFPGMGRRMVAAGANLLVNITNDSWFGDSAAPHQHAAMAVVRCVELRRSLARCANTGVSCLVDPWGRITLVGGVFTREILTGTVTLETGRTFFSRFGGLLDAAWPEAALALLAWSLVAGRRRALRF